MSRKLDILEVLSGQEGVEKTSARNTYGGEQMAANSKTAPSGTEVLTLNPGGDSPSDTGYRPFHSSRELGEIAKALVEVQIELENPLKDATNPFFKSKYATLEAILNHASRVILHKHGLVLLQPFNQELEQTLVVTTLLHTSGQWISSVIESKSEKEGPQAAGSALSYFRRYSALGLLGLAPEDDDGNLASQPKGPSLGGAISEKQVARLYAIAHKNGWKDAQILEVVEKTGFKSVEAIHYQKYEDAVRFFETHRPSQVSDS